MNKLFATVTQSVALISVLALIRTLILVLSCSTVIAGGFDGDKKAQAATQKWQCEYCPPQSLWETELTVNFAFLSDDAFRYSNYTGVEDQQLSLSGFVRNINPDGRYWITEFDKIGTDAQQLNSRYGVQGSYGLAFDFQSIPIRQFDNLVTPFSNSGSNTLRLNDGWNRSNNSADFSNPAHFTQFSLGSDWDRLGLIFSFIQDDNFDYVVDYRRIEKSGLKESAANQLFQATYIPMPIDSVSEEFSAIANYKDQQWFASAVLRFSKFSDRINSVSYATPFLPIDSGANVSRISSDPDNAAMNLSINARYIYMPRSSAKVFYAYGRLTQDDSFLPYTTNQSLISALPQASLNGEIITQNLSLRIKHWFNPQWSLRAKYNYRDRYNKTDLNVYRPIISDLFFAGAAINIPYDLTRTNQSVFVDWRIKARQLLTFGLKSDKTERIFQSVRNTTDTTMNAKYRASYGDQFQFQLNLEQSDRSGSAPELIDLLSVTENPLMQRFNVADRKRQKLYSQFSYFISESLSAVVSAQYVEEDYEQTELGLQYSWQNNLNLDLNWQATDDLNVGLFLEREKIDTNLAGSERFSGRDWLVDNRDEILNYGANISIKNLADTRLALSGSLQLSDADTLININNAGVNSRLPNTTSLWGTAEVKADFRYDDSLSFALSFMYQNFESQDFAIDGVVPGAVADLLTFSAMSNNYNVNYLLLSASYRF